MRTFVTLISILFCLFTCNLIGEVDLTDYKETPKKEINISAEIDLPADMDLLISKIAKDLMDDDFSIPDTVIVYYGEVDDPIETVDSTYGINWISSRSDTLFISPRAFWEKKGEHITLAEAIEIKLIEIEK